VADSQLSGASTRNGTSIYVHRFREPAAPGSSSSRPGARDGGDGLLDVLQGCIRLQRALDDGVDVLCL
jgi:hypothetical protein